MLGKRECVSANISANKLLSSYEELTLAVI